MSEGFIISAVIFIFAVVIHEYAHGWVAYRLGDPTAKLLGRLTLNPIRHIDPVGTILLPVMLSIVHSPIIFGWAKPVPVNFLNLRQPRRDMILVGLAGPAINIILAVILSRFLHLGLPEFWQHAVAMAIIINLVLAIFNLVPIPPLDGSRLVMGLLPNRYAYLYSRSEAYGILIVFILMYLGLLERFVWPIVLGAARLLGVE